MFSSLKDMSTPTRQWLSALRQPSSDGEDEDQDDKTPLPIQHLSVLLKQLQQSLCLTAPELPPNERRAVIAILTDLKEDTGRYFRSIAQAMEELQTQEAAEIENKISELKKQQEALPLIRSYDAEDRRKRLLQQNIFGSKKVKLDKTPILAVVSVMIDLQGGAQMFTDNLDLKHPFIQRAVHDMRIPVVAPINKEGTLQMLTSATSVAGEHQQQYKIYFVLQADQAAGAVLFINEAGPTILNTIRPSQSMLTKKTKLASILPTKYIEKTLGASFTYFLREAEAARETAAPSSSA